MNLQLSTEQRMIFTVKVIIWTSNKQNEIFSRHQNTCQGVCVTIDAERKREERKREREKERKRKREKEKEREREKE